MLKAWSAAHTTWRPSTEVTIYIVKIPMWETKLFLKKKIKLFEGGGEGQMEKKKDKISSRPPMSTVPYGA